MSDHEKISPTAWTIAWNRTFTDIRYSKEIFEQLRQAYSISKEDLARVTRTPERAPVYEARYKLINKLLAQTGIKQILELAAGFTPRGIELTADPSIYCVELDLPMIAREKKKIIKNILGIKTHPNLSVTEGNALLEKDVLRAVDIFKNIGEVAIINEGLLRYLTREEQTLIASNILSILKQRGGAWITPDAPVLSEKRFLGQSEEVRGLLKDIDKITGINRDLNYFKSEEELQSFFEDVGFVVERHSFLEVFDQLSSPKTLSISKESVRTTIENSEHATTFVMRAR